jgi:hypothetical protein
VRTNGLGDFCFIQICGRKAADTGETKKMGKYWQSVGEKILSFFLLKDRFGASCRS